MDPAAQAIKQEEEEVDELVSSDAGDGKNVLVPNGNHSGASPKVTQSPTKGGSRTPPSIPTPPWLTSPLPSLAGPDRDYSTPLTVRTTPTPSMIRAGAPNITVSKYYRARVAAQPTSIFAKTTPAVETSPLASPSSRVRSMSPPEMDREQITDDPLLRGNSSTLQTLGPLTCTTLSVHDALMLRCQLHHDPNRLNVLINILKSMAELMMPNHDMVWNLLVVTEGGYNCPFPACARHRDGWTRADRTRAHIYADHLMIRYKCDKW
jgi:hypothetical protein